MKKNSKTKPNKKSTSEASVQRHLCGLSCSFGAAWFCALCTCRVLSISIFYHVDVLLKLSVWCLFQCLKICCADRTESTTLQPICAHSV